MQNNRTLTFTARSQANPEKIATFTLQDEHVKVELGKALMEQVDYLIDTFQSEESLTIANVLEPAATGAMRHLLQPIPLADFDASLTGNTFQLLAWLRAGGLRVIPIMETWEAVDNPAGAAAFVDELKERRMVSAKQRKLPALFDYWVSWLVFGGVSVAMPFLWYRHWRQTGNELQPSRA